MDTILQKEELYESILLAYKYAKFTYSEFLIPMNRQPELIIGYLTATQSYYRLAYSIYLFHYEVFQNYHIEQFFDSLHHFINELTFMVHHNQFGDESNIQFEQLKEAFWKVYSIIEVV